MDVEVCFIYNARKGWFYGVSDVLHKWWSPETYACDLCRLTHGVTRMRKELRSFLTRTGYRVIFFHLNDLPDSLAGSLNVAGGAPAVLLRFNGEWKTLIAPAELKEQKGVHELLQLLQERMNNVT